MFKSFSIFRSGAHLVEKKTFEEKKRIVHSQDSTALNMQKHFLFVSSFKHVNFAINGKYFKNCCASLVIFQTYKHVVLRSVHSLGGLF
jgi:hypothetical protein